MKILLKKKLDRYIYQKKWSTYLPKPNLSFFSFIFFFFIVRLYCKIIFNLFSLSISRAINSANKKRKKLPTIYFWMLSIV